MESAFLRMSVPYLRCGNATCVKKDFPLKELSLCMPASDTDIAHWSSTMPSMANVQIAVAIFMDVLDYAHIYVELKVVFVVFKPAFLL